RSTFLCNSCNNGFKYSQHRFSTSRPSCAFSHWLVSLFMNRPPVQFVLVTQNCTRRSIPLFAPFLKFGVNHVLFFRLWSDNFCKPWIVSNPFQVRVVPCP